MVSTLSHSIASIWRVSCVMLYNNNSNTNNKHLPKPIVAAARFVCKVKMPCKTGLEWTNITHNIAVHNHYHASTALQSKGVCVSLRRANTLSLFCAHNLPSYVCVYTTRSFTLCENVQYSEFWVSITLYADIPFLYMRCNDLPTFDCSQARLNHAHLTSIESCD